MEQMFYTLHDFMVYSKGWTYTIMGLGLVFYLLFWLFLTGRDEAPRKY
ncbi:sulfate respiration complex protein HmcD [Desulfobaculum bizertense]|uniref:Hmc operon protein 4 n=1 Tax=Desulfobaculum bizertense DSM 18034 TaxID=1121442 RepID=A0A1T4VGC2_9BACT|nr:hypothetical protein [Desulfobaculum bizertense]UIJ37781.1 hypothetical protein LWC08_13965 [Desulfobaculum bizertense]SKA64005.1 hypothetical protein SAMN02745702_00250 [Desulfobaculum bizertense DSM 18034]